METSETALRSKLRFHRILTVVLGALSAFLAVVLLGQLTLDRAPGRAPAESSAGQNDAGRGEPVSGDSPLALRDPADPMAIGAVDAPVVLVQWTDLRCPFCAAFNRDTLPAIIDEYVDAGLVRVEIRDVAYFGEQSEDAAVAARAAGAQGRYFEYVDAIYAAAPGGGHPDLPRERLLAFAEEAGIPDLARFTADLDDPALRMAAQASTVEAQRIGVGGVPFFVAGSTALSGAQPIELFRQFLDEALENAR